MKAENFTIRPFLFLKNNWFKITVVALMMYVIFKKDLNFQVNFQGPNGIERNVSNKPKEKMTDNLTLSAANNGDIEQLEIPLLGGKPSSRNALQELAAIDENTRREYLQRFAKVVVEEQRKYKIPASFLLATAFYQSCAGTRQMTTGGNNHFALPCSDDWNGACGAFESSRYRRYDSAWQSFRDFSQFAATHFPDLKGKDYAAWAKALEKAGFDGEDGFSENITTIVESFGVAGIG